MRRASVLRTDTSRRDRCAWVAAFLCAAALAALVPVALAADPITFNDLHQDEIAGFNAGSHAGVAAPAPRALELGDTGTPPSVSWPVERMPASVLPPEDDVYWSDAFTAATLGLNGTVWALTTWGDYIVAGGDFTTADGAPVGYIALWDGTRWLPLGSGLSAPVYALAVYNGELIAGGAFATAGGIGVYGIARWNGVEWNSLGSGMDNYVRALLVVDNTLIVGGDFNWAGPVYAPKVARWDGSAWSALGNGFSGGYRGYGTRALVMHDGSLYAGGFFTTTGAAVVNHIARWDGTQWVPVGSWTNDTIYSLASYGGHLIAGSVAWTSTANWGNVILQFDGTNWQPVGPSASLDAPIPNAVRALTVYGGDLLAVGQFHRAGGVLVDFVARWDGSSWHALQTGLNAPAYAVHVKGDQLIVGGEFTAVDTTPHAYIVAWDGTSWGEFGGVRTPGLGLDGTVWAMSAQDDGLYVGGEFTLAGPVVANYIARWDGAAWHALGAGMDGKVFAITSFAGKIIAGGEFYTAGSNTAHFVAAWDGTGWQPLGSGLDGPVRALVVYKDRLIAGGDFWTAGGNEARSVAAWDGTAWTPLGDGLTGGMYDFGVRSLRVDGSNLIAGGFFTLSGDKQVSFIARWDGTAWNALGGGLPGVGYSLASYQGALLAGSVVWHNPSEGTWADLLQRWDGTTWTPLGDGELVYPFPNAMRAMTIYRHDLIAAGQFRDAAGARVHFITNLDRSSDHATWKPLGSGLDRPAYTVETWHGALYVGGEFATAGGKASVHFAKWQPPDPGGEPASVSTQLRVITAADGPVEVRYQIARAEENVRVVITDVRGRRVATLHSGPASAGDHLAAWDRRDARGVPVARGVFFVRLETSQRTLSQKVVLVRH